MGRDGSAHTVKLVFFSGKVAGQFPPDRCLAKIMQALLQEMMYRRPTHLRVEKNKGI